MTKFRFRSLKQIDKWIHQNDAECIDGIEGCLLNHLLYACKRGYCYMFETYVNPNMSDYECYFIPYNETSNNPEYDKLCDTWQALVDEQEEII